MKVLVTGASGFIGSGLVQSLLAAGHTVYGMYRRQQLPKALTESQLQYPSQLTLIRFDLDFPLSTPSASAIRSAMRSAHWKIPDAIPDWNIVETELAPLEQLLKNVDACVHIAAMVGDWGSNTAFFAANVVSTRLLLEAATRVRLKRFIYISSIAVHGFGHNRQNTENGMYFRATNPYQCSKRCAESLVAQYIYNGLDACILRPGNVYGNGDTTTFYPLFDAFLKGIMGTVAEGRYLTSPVHINDITSAIALALEANIKEQHRTFNIVSKGVIWKELMDICTDSLNIPRLTKNLPGFFARVIGYPMEFIGKLFRLKLPPPLTIYRVEQLLHDYDFSIESAKQNLNYQPNVDLREGFGACAQAYRQDRGI